MSEAKKIVYVEIVEDVSSETNSTLRQNIYTWEVTNQQRTLTDEQLQNAASKLFEHMNLPMDDSKKKS